MSKEEKNANPQPNAQGQSIGAIGGFQNWPHPANTVTTVASGGGGVTQSQGQGGGSTNNTFYSANQDLHSPLHDKWKIEVPREMQVGELVGFRVWRLNLNVHPLVLRSLNDVPWAYDVIFQMKKDDTFHYWKGPGFHSGIHAFRKWLPAYLESSSYNGLAYVIGSIYMWGTVYVHERGYRCEFAKVRSIDWVKGWSEYPFGGPWKEKFELRRKLRELYKV